jgi:hypothetical protein
VERNPTRAFLMHHSSREHAARPRLPENRTLLCDVGQDARGARGAGVKRCRVDRLAADTPQTVADREARGTAWENCSNRGGTSGAMLGIRLNDRWRWWGLWRRTPQR